MAKPYGDKMAVTVYVTVEQLEKINRASHDDGRSRSSWVLRVLAEKLTKVQN